MANKLSMSPTRAYNWYDPLFTYSTPSYASTDVIPRYISLVAASCMVLYGYDASVYNAVQGSAHWKAWFNHPDDNMIGLINTVYTIGAIISGFFFGGPVADYLGRRAGMGIGAILVIIATLLQTFAPQGNLGMFMAGRIIIGFGQGLALSKWP